MTNVERVDTARSLAQQGSLVLCEEVGRDGAQGRTLLGLEQRLEIAERLSAMFGGAYAAQLVFVTAFPDIATEEFAIARSMASRLSRCQQMVVCPTRHRSVQRALDAVRGARGARILMVVPTTEGIAHSLMREPAVAALERARETLRFALDHADGVAIDLALVDAPRADPGLLAEYASAFTEDGASAMMLCDTVGSSAPAQTSQLFAALRRRCDAGVVLGAHFHNDLGLGLANTLAAMAEGVRYIASSVLGLGERSGMTATEQLLAVLANEPESLADRYGIQGPLWASPPHLHDLVPLARDVAGWVGARPRTTDPVWGSGVNSISTGTPFTNPTQFVPYDANALLGVAPRVHLTHLASHAVLREVLRQRDVVLTHEQLRTLLPQIKSWCYAANTAEIPDAALDELVAGLGGDEVPAAVWVAVEELPDTPALPWAVMEASIDALLAAGPTPLARRKGGRLQVSQEVADVCVRVSHTDFSRHHWCLDEPVDRRALAIWAAIGGSFFADFGVDPTEPRIFGWGMSPLPAATRYALGALKGRDGRWIATSISAPPETFLPWVDQSRSPVNRAQLDALFGLGPVGIRLAAQQGCVHPFFLHHGRGGTFLQVVNAGDHSPWMQLTRDFCQLTGQPFLAVSSANRTGQGTHKDLRELMVDLGPLGVPIAAGPVSVDGELASAEDRVTAYRQLHGATLALSPAARADDDRLLPTSTTLVAPGHSEWRIERHGSLHWRRIASRLSTVGVTLRAPEAPRLEPSDYVGGALVDLPMFSCLDAHTLSEVGRMVAVRRLEPGELVVRAGELADEMYVVLEGTCLVWLDGQKVSLEQGQFFGEVALLRSTSRSATVSAATEARVAVLSSHVLHRLMEESPGLASMLRQTAQDRVPTTVSPQPGEKTNG